MKILMLSYWFPPKIAPAPHELARHLVKLGHEVCVLSGTFNNSLSSEELDGVHVFRFRQYFSSVPGHITYGLKVAAKLVDLQRRMRFDITQANGADGWAISKLNIKAKLRTPVIVTMHGSAKQELDSLETEDMHGASRLIERMHWRFQYFLDKWSLESADKIVAVSKQTADDVARDYKVAKNIEVIYNGVDTARFSPKRYSLSLKEKFRTTFMLLYVGRLRFRKGVQYLIKALPFVLKSLNDAHLVIVGEGEAKESLRSLVNNLGVEKHVTFVGRVSSNHLPMYYASSDAFVCPSLYEPFGLVCLEALASGTPLILTDRVGAKEIVSENVARVVKARDERALASAICEVACEERRRRSMAVKGRRLAEKYDWINIAKKMSEVYADA